MSIKKQTIPIIDLFAGPGGLGEGFSSVLNEDGERVFDIRLSIEMEPNAHKTLELRSFFRKFPPGKAPELYYKLLRQNTEKDREIFRERLFQEYPEEAQKAKEEAWSAELGGTLFPSEKVDRRIEKALNGETDWVLIGGPPCQAYSVVGRSRRQWKDNVDKGDKRVHLYKEYLRIIAGHHPSVFVMENVKGLLSSKVDGKNMFDLIKADLSNPSAVFPELESPGYRIYSLVQKPSDYENGNPVYKTNMDYLIKSEKYGVPQKRHRVILMGVRADVDYDIEYLNLHKNQVNIEDVIGDLPKIRGGINRSFDFSELLNGKKKRNYQKLANTDENWNILIRSFAQEISKWNEMSGDFYFIQSNEYVLNKGGEYLKFKTPSPKNPLFNWYNDSRLGGVCNHESRTHLLQDLKRYLFASMFAQMHKRYPRLEEYEMHSDNLMPDHENAKSGKFADRFRVQVAHQPATTITSHISKDGHYFIHYEPAQCRSLTVREAARVQTFPDNYLFCGSRTAQFHQVGNAVPPYLALQIGQIVKKIVSHEGNL